MCTEIERLNRVISPQISPFRGLLYFARLQEPTPGATIAGQGGFGLVDTGNKKLLVTCNHVWEGFLEKMQFQIWIFTLLFQETFPDMVAGNQKFLISRVHQPKTSLAGYSSTRCRLLKTSKIEQPAKWADLRADHTIQPFNFGAHTIHRI